MKNNSSSYIHETGHASTKPLAAIALAALLFGGALSGPALRAPSDPPVQSSVSAVAAPTP